MTKVIDVVEVGVLDPDGKPAPFRLVFFGVDYNEFMITPGGGSKIREAFKRHGLAGYMSSPFMIHRVRKTW